MNTGYLGNYAERIESLSELREGDMYAVGRGKDSFIAFEMPGQENIRGDFPISFSLYDTPIYEAVLHQGKIKKEDVKRKSTIYLDNLIDVEIAGVFRPVEGSELRRTIKAKLKN